MYAIIRQLSVKLNVTPLELKKIIANILIKDVYEEELLELLGYDNILEVENICMNKEYFVETEELKTFEDSYIEIKLPVQEKIDINPDMLISTDSIGSDSAYFEYQKFNAVQSKVFNCAYETDQNYLVCAPTGCGKTDVALLSMLRALRKKALVVYVVPMKALAYEITCKYKQKLVNYNVTEFTGDTDVSRHNLLQSDVIICTPEKFDAYTRKLDNVFRDRVGLVVVDEIHILQDVRGCVIETIIGRMLRYTETKQKHIRIVGLSATLPNYKDVGLFIRASKVYNFDQGYRPVSLQTSIIGIYENALLQMEEVFVQKLQELLRQKKQVLVFVNSRSSTITTAKYIIDKLYNGQTLNVFPANVDGESGTKHPRHLKLSGTLERLLSHNIGVHHAGLPRNIRVYMENKFKNNEINIMICTSTLAWGVNLPAHAVIIKGTQYYDPNVCKITDLGILDIFQIFGRAGRPQYNVTGEAILMTTYKNTSKYLSMIKNELEIESQLLKQIANLVNAEIYLNNISNLSDGILWFKNTYMYIRCKSNPFYYGVDKNDVEASLGDYLYLTILKLEECGLITVQRKAGDEFLYDFKSTEFGRISSFYYLDHETILHWSNCLKTRNNLDIVLLILECKDFENIQYRKEEEHDLQEITKALGIYPDIDDTTQYKLYVLVMAFLSGYQISNFALKCDLGFISKNYERCLEAFVEMVEYMKDYDTLQQCLYMLSQVKYRSVKQVFDKNKQYFIKNCKNTGEITEHNCNRNACISAGGAYTFRLADIVTRAGYTSANDHNKMMHSRNTSFRNKCENDMIINVMECGNFLRIIMISNIHMYWMVLSTPNSDFYIKRGHKNIDVFVKSPDHSYDRIQIKVMIPGQHISLYCDVMIQKCYLCGTCNNGNILANADKYCSPSPCHVTSDSADIQNHQSKNCSTTSKNDMQYNTTNVTNSQNKIDYGDVHSTDSYVDNSHTQNSIKHQNKTDNASDSSIHMQGHVDKHNKDIKQQYINMTPFCIKHIQSCVHDNSYDINFYQVYYTCYQEFILTSVDLYINDLYNTLIVTRTYSDCKLLTQEIYTKAALRNISSDKNEFMSICNDINQFSNNVCIVTFKEALKYKGSAQVIMLGCRNEQYLYYHIPDVLAICNNRNVLIYEESEFIEYMNDTVLCSSAQRYTEVFSV